MKKRNFLLLCACAVILLTGSLALASSGTVYLNGSQTTSRNLGTREDPYQELTAALRAVPDGGTIVVLGSTVMQSEVTTDKAVTLQGETAGHLFFRYNLLLGGDLTVQNLELEFTGTDVRDRKIYANGHNLTLKDVTIPDKTSTGIAITNFPTIYGGGRTADPGTAGIITINSGRYENIYAGSDTCNTTGSPIIDFSGTAAFYAPGGNVNGIYAATNGKSITGDVTIRVHNTFNAIPTLDGGRDSVSGRSSLSLVSYANGKTVTPDALMNFDTVSFGGNTDITKSSSPDSLANLGDLSVPVGTKFTCAGLFNLGGNLTLDGALVVWNNTRITVAGSVTGGGTFTLAPTAIADAHDYITAKAGSTAILRYLPNAAAEAPGYAKGYELLKTNGANTIWALAQYDRIAQSAVLEGAAELKLTADETARSYTARAVDQNGNSYLSPFSLTSDNPLVTPRQTFITNFCLDFQPGLAANTSVLLTATLTGGITVTKTIKIVDTIIPTPTPTATPTPTSTPSLTPTPTPTPTPPPVPGGGGGGGGGGSAVAPIPSPTPGGAIVLRPTEPQADGSLSISLSKDAISAIAASTSNTVHAENGGIRLTFDTDFIPKNTAGIKLQVAPQSDGSIVFAFTADDKHLPAAQDAVLVRMTQSEHTLPLRVLPDGTRVPIRKSAAVDGNIYFTLSGSDTVVLAPNTAHFADLDPHWSRSAGEFMAARHLLRGITTVRFGPDDAMTRGMFVTVLHRLEDEPSTASAGFPDVPQELYCADAARWARQAGIAKGAENGDFFPNRELTREELVTLLYAYAKPAETPATDAADRFPDAAAISPWARQAAAWAVQNGIITGRPDGSFNPKGIATRGEVAATIQRFMIHSFTK